MHFVFMNLVVAQFILKKLEKKMNSPITNENRFKDTMKLS